MIEHAKINNKVAILEAGAYFCNDALNPRRIFLTKESVCLIISCTDENNTAIVLVDDNLLLVTIDAIKEIIND